MFQFPFGQPIIERKPRITEPRSVYILGAYPSALHVRWEPPLPNRPIQAIAVDNEPEPFWSGEGEKAFIDSWMKQVHYEPEWGKVYPAGRLNGSSGVWVDTQILQPMALERGKAVWMSDCLDTYRLSEGLSRRLVNTYRPLAEKFTLPMHNLIPHPSEQVIGDEAGASHLIRTREELKIAKPSIIITLGNAALRIMRQIVLSNASAPDKLVPSEEEYGKAIDVEYPSGRGRWIPLAHPAAPRLYQMVHYHWVKMMGEN